MAKYNALLIGLQVAEKMGVKYYEANGDLKLIVNEVEGEYKVINEDLVIYSKLLEHGPKNSRGSILIMYPKRTLHMLISSQLWQVL